MYTIINEYPKIRCKSTKKQSNNKENATEIAFLPFFYYLCMQNKLLKP